MGFYPKKIVTQSPEIRNFTTAKALDNSIGRMKAAHSAEKMKKCLLELPGWMKDQVIYPSERGFFSSSQKHPSCLQYVRFYQPTNQPDIRPLWTVGFITSPKFACVFWEKRLVLSMDFSRDHLRPSANTDHSTLSLSFHFHPMKSLPSRERPADQRSSVDQRGIPQSPVSRWS